MVAETTTFDAEDFVLPLRPVWYIRKAGWVRGPYTLEDMRRIRQLGWLSSTEAVSRDMQSWEPAGGVSEIWAVVAQTPENAHELVPPPVPIAANHWRYTSDGQPNEEPVSFATLQILAALGRLHAADMVWREGWRDWRNSADVPGLLAGPSEWCTACGEPVSPRSTRCKTCGSRLPGFSVPHAELCVACGILGLVLFPAFPLWLIAIFMGNYDLAEIAKGRMDPAGRNSASLGLRLGIIGGAVFGSVTLMVLLWILLRRLT